MKQLRNAWLALCLAGVSSVPTAQESKSPMPADLEPKVDTSANPPPAAADGAAKAANESATPEASPTVQAAPSQPRRTEGGRVMDRIDLEATQITGNRELPKVLYIVPWKRADLGDLIGKPANSLLDEVLEPVDRDVFRRQNRYYDALKPDTPQRDAPQGGGGEKPPAP